MVLTALEASLLEISRSHCLQLPSKMKTMKKPVKNLRGRKGSKGSKQASGGSRETEFDDPEFFNPVSDDQQQNVEQEAEEQEAKRKRTASRFKASQEIADKKSVQGLTHGSIVTVVTDDDAQRYDASTAPKLASKPVGVLATYMAHHARGVSYTVYSYTVLDARRCSV